jgi:hypothetical protein
MAASPGVNRTDAGSSKSHYARRLLERRHLAGICIALLGRQTFRIPNQADVPLAGKMPALQ